MRISDWSSDVCSSDLGVFAHEFGIDRDEIAVLDEVAEFGERGAGLDKRMNLHAAPIQRVGADGQEKLPPLRAAIEGGAAGAERPPRAAAAPRCRGSRRRACGQGLAAMAEGV